MKRALVRWLSRRSRRGMVLLGALVAIVVIIPGALVVAYETQSSCSDAYRKERWETAVATCRAGHERDGNEHDLFLMIEAFYWLQRDADLIAFAPRLLSGAYAADTHRLLAYVFAIPRRLSMTGRLHIGQAFAMHVAARDRVGLMKDLKIWAGIERFEENYQAALRLNQTSVRLANVLGEEKLIAAANIGLGDVAFEMGKYKLAAESFRVVESHRSVLSAYERVELELKMGEMWSAESDADPGRLEDALAAFGIADRELASCQSQPWGLQSQIWLNQIAILSLRDLDAASALLDKVDVEEKQMPDALLWRASISAARGQIAAAALYLQQAETRGAEVDDVPLRAARMRGNLAELMKDSTEAEARYRLAISMITKERRESRAESGYIVAGHRGAYDDLIHLLANQQRWTDVLEVILSMDVSDMLHSDREEGLDCRNAMSAGVNAPAVQAVISAWRGRDLVIVVAPTRRFLGPDPNVAYRIRVHDGEVTGEPIGDAQALRSMINKVNDMRDPQFTVWAKRIVPESTHGEPLSVLLVGPLSGLPLSAFAGVANPSMTQRTLVRAQSLSTRTSPPHSVDGVAIFADSDPLLPLPAAAAEADVVASLSGEGAAVYKSRDATFEQLELHRSVNVLHVATHVTTEGGQHAIHLADRDVDQSDIINHGISPRLVVLSGCGSAAAGDAEGWESVATAFLEAGTRYVVATAYNIEDGAGPILMREFYSQPDVLDDPAHALAVAQRHVIAHATPEQLKQYIRSWLAYSVLVRPPVIPAKS